MQKLTLLSAQSHQQLHLKDGLDFDAFNHKQTALLTVHELAAASSSFPLFLIKNTTTSQFESVALMSLVNQNVFFAQSTTVNVAYLPLSLQLLPFSSMVNPEDANNMMVLIDENSSLLSTDTNNTTALFQADGNAGQGIIAKQNAMAQFAQQQLTTTEFIKQLVDADLLKELTLEITFSNGEKSTLKGLHTIKEEQLSQLSEEDKKRFEARGYYPAIFGMLASLTQMNRMLQLHNQQSPEQLISNMQFATEG